jgi:hypothetical protein
MSLAVASRTAIAPLHADTREAVADLAGYLRIEVDPADRRGWMARDLLSDPDRGPAADLFARLEAAGFGPNRRAAAASLLLRYGWSSGFVIAAYLACARVPGRLDLRLKFSKWTLLEAIWVREATFVGLGGDPLAGSAGWTRTAASRDELRAALIESLIEGTEPLVERMHQWSRFSRHALWSMVVSSWAAQFVAVGEQLGEPCRALAEARAVLTLDPRIAKATPELYEVSDGQSSKVCQNRAACCLYFKSPRRHFCASCPIIPKSERLQRNLEWVQAQTKERALAAV